MNIDLIDTFLAIVYTGNISKAAANLYVSQSTVSSRLSKLENLLGIKLFNRQKGKQAVDITPAGFRFIPLAKRWQELLQSAEMLKDNHFKGRIRIASCDSLTNAFLSPLFTELLEKQQDAHQLLSFFSYESWHIYDQLIKEEIDLGIVSFVTDKPSLVAVPVMSHGFALLRGPDAEPIDVLTDFNVLDPKNQVFRIWGPLFRSWHHEVLGPYTGKLIFNSTSSLFDLLNKGNRWCIVPDYVAYYYKEHFGFQASCLVTQPPRRTFYLVKAVTQGWDINERLSYYENEITSYFSRRSNMVSEAFKL